MAHAPRVNFVLADIGLSSASRPANSIGAITGERIDGSLRALFSTKTSVNESEIQLVWRKLAEPRRSVNTAGGSNEEALRLFQIGSKSISPQAEEATHDSSGRRHDRLLSCFGR